MKFNRKVFDEHGTPLNVTDTLASLPSVAHLKKTNRVEVIDEHGWSYTNMHPDNKVEISYQEDGKTLKIYISR